MASTLRLLTAFAVRHRVGPRLRYTVAAASLSALAIAVAVINGGSIGGGGTGNLGEGATDVGLARLSYATGGGFEPLAADLVGIDAGSGAATARRARLDEPADGADEAPGG